MAIRRNISVLNQGISSDIDIVYGTDLVPIEFYITDYSLPDNAIATLYCTTSDNESHKDVGEIANNVITFNPVAGFFSVGKNKLQIRITADEKNLFSFEMCANCKSNMTNDDAVEVESQPTLVTQLLTKVGEVNALFKEIQDAIICRLENSFVMTSDEVKTMDTLFGKPVYTKSYRFTDSIQADTVLNYPHGITDAKYIWVDLQNSFFISITNGFCTTAVETRCYGKTSLLQINVDQNSIICDSDGGWNNDWIKVITLRYTKTTD